MSTHRAGVRKGLWIEGISVLWMAVEAGVAFASGMAAHSLALVALGADSVIEWIAGVVLLGRLWVEAAGAKRDRVERAERMASWTVGVALLLLAAYIVIASVHKLWTHQGAESSPLGLALAVVSGLLMPILSRAKIRIGTEIGSSALRADGACSIVCAYMAWTVLAGVVATTLFGWWWTDSAAAIALVYFVAKEGWEAIEEARGESCGCGCGCGGDEPSGDGGGHCD
ncbi:MAG: cation transporter [Thermoflavifilum sp.]|nr:cation transporter [Thermoflavifilum sp.]MCL6513229.1 cation transporter [Alicyclobacillus sp.]